MGTTTSHLHFPHLSAKWYSRGRIHPEYSITHDNRVSVNKEAIHIGAVVQSNPMIAQKLWNHDHTFQLLFDSKESETVLDYKGCDHQIKLIGAEDQLRMGPIYHISQKEE